MARSALQLYIDIVSPFAYLAFWATRNLSIFEQCDVIYTPILLGGLLKACGNSPPIGVKNKNKWLDSERLRLAKAYQIPMDEQQPEGSPVNTLLTQRVLCAISIINPGKLADSISALFHNLWVQHHPVSLPDEILKVLTPVLGDEVAGKVIEKASTPEVKQLLLSNTDRAFNDGGFGLPFFVATNTQGKTAGFWGFERLDQVINHLGLEETDTKSSNQLSKL